MVQHPPHVVIVGGAYAGLSVARNLVNICDGNEQLFNPMPIPTVSPPSRMPAITLIDERDGIFHTMGSPLSIVSESFAKRSWMPFSSIGALPQFSRVSFKQGRVTRVDPASKKLFWRRTPEQRSDCEEEVESYDYLVVASGLRRQWPAVPKAFLKDGFVMDVRATVDSFSKAETPIVVIGGGAVGVEMASEIKNHFASKEVILFHSRSELLSSEPLPSDFKAQTRSLLADSGVSVRLGCRVLQRQQQLHSSAGQTLTKLDLSDGEHIIAEIVIDTTTGHKPSTDFLPTEALDADGFVKILPSLQFSPPVPSNACHFAAGDIMAWSGIKRVGVALYSGHFVATNIAQMMNGTPSEDLTPLPEISPTMALAAGTTAVAYSPREGVTFGPQVKEHSFSDDLGLEGICNSACWNAFTNIGKAVGGIWDSKAEHRFSVM
ncbi:hypothetical protein CLAIMM_04686 [Cladophialophora immunda]|nr:hypothetical protein CLAIMM_04686 [Cladophialophora immunda]